jgi:5'(3')-deoxyribonucleotidase
MKERATTAGLTPPATGSADPKTIAVDLDDTLNNFTETLRHGQFPYDRAEALPEATFHRYLEKIQNDTPEAGDLLSTEYSFFRYKIHARCYRMARARPDGVEFMQRLQRNHWRIVICTQRDLRRVNDGTRAWLKENAIPFDYLFMALNKIVFCKAWGIRHLVDDDVFNLAHGGRYGVSVYYPIMPKHQSLPEHAARGFQTFAEVERWIQE